MLPIEHPDKRAVLLWFEAGKKPTKKHFDPADPVLRAEPWWFMHDALDHAVQQVCIGSYLENHKPWILYRGRILDEAEIVDEYGRLSRGEASKY